jgi:hypothetical protein
MPSVRSAGTQMLSAGYDVKGLLRLQVPPPLAASPEHPEGSERVPPDATGQASGWPPVSVRSMGVALSMLPFLNACNNPVCLNLAGPRELQLVSGHSCICAGCHVARYCGRLCQRQHWKQHKPACKVLAAAQAVATAAGTGDGGVGNGGAE